MLLYQKVVLAGGNGYLGQVLANYYKNLCHQIVILSRKPAATVGNISTVLWDGESEGSWERVLDGADMLINLCGKNVNCRYTDKNKKAIIQSRVKPTALLGRAISKLTHPPKLWINVTSATIYRHAEDHAQDEFAGEIGQGFSVEVCKEWEQTFFEAQTPGARKVALRMGIVLGRGDGVFPRLLNLVKLGLGGKQGNGHQQVSWIHEQDVAQITKWLLQHPEMDGIINCTAPQTVSNTNLMHTIRKCYGMPFGLPSPQWLLEIGARLIGTETELILKSRWVAPQRLLDAGYAFRFAGIASAISNILKQKS
ncbi:TIGR01777 family oxidoreductase [Mucilaginibacter sp. CSA2-8R]|uniref:TIGR01777 family oxidoreductase n=1 Tax=Mucilaginibacter sp. CSA2-8R TaxID=3141542 RepID=UPI00315CE4E2